MKLETGFDEVVIAVAIIAAFLLAFLIYSVREYNITELKVKNHIRMEVKP